METRRAAWRRRRSAITTDSSARLTASFIVFAPRTVVAMLKMSSSMSTRRLLIGSVYPLEVAMGYTGIAPSRRVGA